MNTIETIKKQCQLLRLGAVTPGVEQLADSAAAEGISYLEFTKKLLDLELNNRKLRDMERREKAAKLPSRHQLELYDSTSAESLPKVRLEQLKELTWLDQNYNIILMGPSGTGKTFLSAGLCHHALKNGYRAYFRTMEQIMAMLRNKDISTLAKADYSRLSKAQLIVIDDIMIVSETKVEANAFFHFINALHEKTSFVITTNKSPKQWVEVLGDEVITTALLDRLLYRCEIIQLSGESYRMQNRKSIFETSK